MFVREEEEEEEENDNFSNQIGAITHSNANRTERASTGRALT